MRPILLVAPALLLLGCPMLQTLAPPADAPSVGYELNTDAVKESNPAVAKLPLARQPIAANYRDLPLVPLHWSPPLISSFADTVAPGVVVYWVSDSSLPLASVQLVWPEGRLALDPGQDAAAGLLGAFLRQGGAGALSSSQLDDTLEFLAAHASVAVGMVRTTASVGGLSRDLPFLLNVLGDMLVAPRFDTARLSTLKQERLQDLEHGFDTPAQCLGLAYDRVAYGPSAWTRLTDTLDIKRLSVRDFRAALQGRFGSQVLISVAGSVDRPAIRQQLVALLRRLAAVPGVPVAKLDSLAPVPELRDRGVWIFNTPATQSNIRIGTRFVRRDHPDYYPLMLASEVLGGSGFGSRLVDRVRSDEGLAYFVRSSVGSDYDRPGMLGVGLQTKVASTGRAIKIIWEEIHRLSDSGFRAGELDRARQGLAASVPTLFDTPEATADLILQSAAWHRQDDHFRRYLRALDSIPEPEILRVFRKWFVPDSLRIVVAGPADQLRATFADGSPGLDAFGPVRVWTADSLRKP